MASDAERHAGDHQRRGADARQQLVCTVVAVTMIIAVIGRKARPVLMRREAEVLLQ